MLATGGDEMAARVTSENLAAAAERMGESQRKATSYLADAATPEALHAAWKEARVAIRHQADVEKGVDPLVGRALSPIPPAAPKQLARDRAASIDKTAAALTDEARAAYALHAQRLNTPPVYEPPLTPEEKEACEPDGRVRRRQATFSGCGGGAGAAARAGGGAAPGAARGGGGRGAAPDRRCRST